MENEKDYMEIDLVEVFAVIRDNLRNIFAVILCCVVLAAGYLVIKPSAPLPEEAPWDTQYRSDANVRIKVVEYCGEIKPSNTMYRASCSDGESHHFF